MSILRLINIEFAMILLTSTFLGGYGGYMLADALLSDVERFKPLQRNICFNTFLI